MYLEKTSWFKSLNRYKDIMIFGAKNNAHRTYGHIKNAGFDISCYVVSERMDNPLYLDNKPVKIFDEISQEHKENCLIVISQGYKSDDDMRNVLLNAGFQNIISGADQITADITDETRDYGSSVLGKKIQTVQEFLQDDLKPSKNNANICIYAVTSQRNQHKTCKKYQSPYIKYIFAGGGASLRIVNRKSLLMTSETIYPS